MLTQEAHTSIDGIGMVPMMEKVEEQSYREEPCNPTLWLLTVRSAPSSSVNIDDNNTINTRTSSVKHSTHHQIINQRFQFH